MRVAGVIFLSDLVCRGHKQRTKINNQRLTASALTAFSKSGSPGSAARPRARLVLSTGLRNRVRTFSTHEKSKNKNLPPVFSFSELHLISLEPPQVGVRGLIRQQERAKERFESGEHLRPAVDSDWACPEVKGEDGVGMALQKR